MGFSQSHFEQAAIFREISSPAADPKNIAKKCEHLVHFQIGFYADHGTRKGFEHSKIDPRHRHAACQRLVRGIFLNISGFFITLNTHKWHIKIAQAAHFFYYTFLHSTEDG